MEDCLFCKIAAGDIPSKKLYEDEQVVAFYDIAPQAKVHFLVIPKKHIPCLLYTSRFPVVRLRPTQPSFHIFSSQCFGLRPSALHYNTCLLYASRCV